MNEKDFYDRFVRLLENTKEKYELDTMHDALIVWIGENYSSLDPEDTAERIVRDSHAEGIDAILIDSVNYELLFVQSKIVDNFDNTQKNIRLDFQQCYEIIETFEQIIYAEISNNALKWYVEGIC